MPSDLDFSPAYHPASRLCSPPSPSSSPLMTENPLLNHVPAAFHIRETAYAPPYTSTAQAKAGAEVRVSDYSVAGDGRMLTMTAGRRGLRGRVFDYNREDTSAVIGGDKQDDEDGTVLSYFSSSDDDEEDNGDHDANAEASTHDHRDSSESEDMDDLELSGDDVEGDLEDSNLRPRRQNTDSSYDRPGQRISHPSSSFPSRHRRDPTPYPSRAKQHTLVDEQYDVLKTHAHGDRRCLLSEARQRDEASNIGA
ncbi:unnamed protein product [Zymoseptoria tritici ST99CH_1E4]|uniref:Uncharacterized protein n=1 Tax=Zymoseptoria tritici ST99CH_1E4 TaxID=1276532 RepID=A0A2H1H9B4_ZYMTR|nr:unnamed protein product [Zymoseptoria tritici ST99CH_1E4]